MPWDKDTITRLIDIEEKLQNVPTGLARAVGYHESGFDPQIEGDGGASIGVFQLQKKAAIDAGIDPKDRWDPAKNIFAGVRYLRQKLDQSGGKIDEALSRYNRGTPDYRGIGDPNYVQRVKRYYQPEGVQPSPAPPPSQQPGILARAASMLSPASAEAATPQAAPRSRLEEIEAELARRDQQAAPQASPAAPGGTQTPPSVSQTTPAPQTQPQPQETPQTPDTAWTPGMRFQALPSIAQLEPADRMQKTKLFESLDPTSQAEFLQSEEPVAAGLAAGGGPAPRSQPVTDPKALLAVGGRPPAPSTNPDQQARVREELAAWEQQAGRPWREGDPRMPSEKRLGVPDEAPVTESLTAPSTMIPLLMPGAGLKLVPGALKTAAPLVSRAVRAGTEGLSQTLGWTAGRTAETGQVPSPAEIGKEAAWNVGTGGALEIPGALLRKPANAVLRRTPGAQTLLNQQAVQEAEGLGKRVFNAQDKEVVGKAFDAVVATGEKLDIAPVRNLWKTLTVAEQRVATNELNKISSTFAGSLKTPTSTWDIGELQHLRSELGKASSTKRTPETIDILQSLRGSIDEAIHNGMAKGSLPAAELIEAQKAWRKVMQAEELQGRVTRYTKDSPNLKWQELNLAALNKELRGGGKKSTQRLVADMNPTERQVLQQELDGLQRHYPFIRITPTAANVVNLASLVHAGGRVMSGDIGGAVMSLTPILITAAISSPRIMSMFKSSIIEGKGQLTSRHIDTLINAIRHENEGETPAQSQ